MIKKRTIDKAKVSDKKKDAIFSGNNNNRKKKKYLKSSDEYGRSISMTVSSATSARIQGISLQIAQQNEKFASLAAQQGT